MDNKPVNHGGSFQFHNGQTIARIPFDQEGILIVTTNLAGSFDEAFERRFLYKICFEKPDATVRKNIWMSMMPNLSEADACTLAEKYDFSGGQIENISRKATINAILYGEESSGLETMMEYCNA